MPKLSESTLGGVAGGVSDPLIFGLTNKNNLYMVSAQNPCTLSHYNVGVNKVLVRNSLAMLSGGRLLPPTFPLVPLICPIIRH